MMINSQNKTEVIAGLRRDYDSRVLEGENLAKNPFSQFENWFEDALAADFLEPNAMTIATVGDSGMPSARMVLLKHFDERGFVFFTNYTSRKGEEIKDNPWAALLFWWDKLERQIRIEGSVEKISAGESDDYFSSRPRSSQISAWISKQSTIIPNRKSLETRARHVTQDLEGIQISRPEFWGGFRVKPIMFEFWQGRKSRLHDRARYLKRDENTWQKIYLAP